MISIEATHPLSLTDINNLKTSNIHNINKVFKYFYVSSVVLMLIGYVLMDYTFVMEHVSLKEFVGNLIFATGVFSALVPVMLKNIFGMDKIVGQVFNEADPQQQHICEALILMPGMESWYKYYTAVQKEGRTITTIECNAIHDAYNKLI